jgi:hypothetical protein
MSIGSALVHVALFPKSKGLFSFVYSGGETYQGIANSTI